MPLVSVPQPGEHVRHTRNQNIYRVIANDVAAKQDEGQWVPSVLYVDVKNTEQQYCRDLVHFMQNFDPANRTEVWAYITARQQ